MIKATKIKMQAGKSHSNLLTEIESIYLEGVKDDDFYKKENVHNFLVKNPNNPVHVNIAPYPKLIPVTSANGQKYVRSEANQTTTDNLLQLPRV
ncbi:DUF3892 domain-containing protein [Streptococcus agalactiae]|uniref:DUF3892 domain-containing protein n=1 Tax=Streptococcus agalactiae TaxID=1311 RepID=UPI002555606E|nr:DUF3892 domain-containing protein [Streptococcus agalactiae]MDK8747723.1 DUF3892 domain-containing protein [Streptococcus agalactiae]